MSPFESLAQLMSSQIVNCLVLGIAVAAVAGAASVLIGRKSAGLRFAIWFAALGAITFLFLFLKPTVPSGAGRVNVLEISLRPEWALYIFCAWVFFAAIGFLRVVRGLWRVYCLKRSCTQLDDALESSVRTMLGGMSRKFALCTSERLRVPAALGFFRPVIALPTWALRELSPEELKMVVLHEAAHLERWDDWTNLLQKVIRAALFFHPAVWWIDSRLSMEREMSCDDMVLANSGSAHHYAACLVSLAEKTHVHRSLALVQAAVSQLKHTAKRISKILDGNQRTARPLLRPAMAALATFGALSLVAVRHTPQLVRFSSSAETSSSLSPSNDKFDYVANANPPAGKAVLASLHSSAVPTVTRPKATASAATSERARIKPMKRLPAPARSEEASNRLDDKPAAVVNAAMSENYATPSFVFLVTQTEQYDGFGNVAITTSVWRIRVIKPVPTQTQTPPFPNKT